MAVYKGVSEAGGEGMNDDSTKVNDPGTVPLPPVPLPNINGLEQPDPTILDVSHRNGFPTGSVPGGPGGSYGSGESDGGKSDSGKSTNEKRRGIIIAVIVAVLIIIGGVIGWRIMASRSYANAMGDCRTQVNALADAQKTAKSQLEKANAVVGTDANNVADATTLTTLKTAISDVDVDAASLSCNDGAPARELRSVADSAKTALDKLNASTTALGKAVKAVESSKDAKTLGDAKAALQKQIDAAEKLMATSKGRVKDNDRSRHALERQIADAKTVLKSATAADDTTLNSLKSATRGVGSSIDAVNTSVREKAAADKKAQEAAADKSRCAAIVGVYAPANSGGGPAVDAGCNIGSGAWPASQYVSGSYKNLGGGRFSWSTSDGSKLTYYPAGTYAPLQSTMTPEFLAPAGITDPTNTPKIEVHDNPNSMGGIGTLMFKG